VTPPELPRSEDNVERVVRYSLVGYPDFEYDFGGKHMWAPHDLMIRFSRATSYRGGEVTERTLWRLTNVELHAWRRLKSGAVSDKVDLLIEFDDLPHEFLLRGLRAKEPDYRRPSADGFPYVLEMVDACRPASGELV
jgi:hypothetical protein